MRVYARRRIIERIESRRNAQLTGVFANPNYDKQKSGEADPRQDLIQSIEEFYNDEIRRILSGSSRQQEEQEADREIEENPFYRNVD